MAKIHFSQLSKTAELLKKFEKKLAGFSKKGHKRFSAKSWIDH